MGLPPDNKTFISAGPGHKWIEIKENLVVEHESPREFTLEEKEALRWWYLGQDYLGCFCINGSYGVKNIKDGCFYMKDMQPNRLSAVCLAYRKHLGEQNSAGGAEIKKEPEPVPEEVKAMLEESNATQGGGPITDAELGRFCREMDVESSKDGNEWSYKIRWPTGGHMVLSGYSRTVLIAELIGVCEKAGRWKRDGK